MDPTDPDPEHCNCTLPQTTMVPVSQYGETPCTLLVGGWCLDPPSRTACPRIDYAELMILLARFLSGQNI
jgi:hypothetical protein